MEKRAIVILINLFFFLPLSVASIDTIQWIAKLDSLEQICYETNQEFKMIQIAKKSNRLIHDYYGEQSEQYLLSLLHISKLYQNRMNNSKSNIYHHLAYNPYMEKIRLEFSEKSEKDKVTYWQTASKYFDKTLSIAFAEARNHRFDDGGEMAAAAFDALLLYKGLLLNLSRDFESFILSNGNDEEKKLWEERKQAQVRGDSVHQDSLDYVILNMLSARGNKYQVPNLTITWQHVQKCLQKEDVAIEFFKNSSGQYAAVLIRRGWKSPKIVRLGKKRSNTLLGKKQKKMNPMLDTDISMYISHCDSVNSIVLQNRLSKYIWPDALLQYFPTGKDGRVFFSTDGMLSQIGIEYLPFNGKSLIKQDSTYYSMSDAFEMHRLSSTRQLVLNTSSSSIDSAIIYGGIQFDADESDLKRESENYSSNKTYVSRISPGNTLERYANFLKGTEVEANYLYEILRKNEIPAVLYTSYKAIEESFYSLSGKKYSLLHFGTHGFYSPQTRSEPLSTSGLLMAGANLTLLGYGDFLPKDVNDGILTAREISLVDLQGCELAVLSACESAKGSVDSEGVWGLQRSFKMAGVNSIIMSLWKIDDIATQLFMSEFYNNLIEKKQSKHDAFRNAQNTLRFMKDLDGKFMYSDPIFWAGFILLD